MSVIWKIAASLDLIGIITMLSLLAEKRIGKRTPDWIAAIQGLGLSLACSG